MSRKPYSIKYEELAREINIEEHEIEVDLSFMSATGKEIKSIKVLHNGMELWKAYNASAKDINARTYFTENPKHPQILNVAVNPPTIRGNLAWMDTSGNPAGKNKGVKNRISVKQACEKLGANPAEFLAAVMMGNVGVLKQHRIKDPQNITMAQKMKSAEILLNKLVPNLKPADLDHDGEARITSEGGNEERVQMHIVMPGQPEPLQIEATKKEADEALEMGFDNYIREKQHELSPDDNNDEYNFVWGDNDE